MAVVATQQACHHFINELVTGLLGVLDFLSGVLGKHEEVHFVELLRYRLASSERQLYQHVVESSRARTGLEIACNLLKEDFALRIRWNQPFNTQWIVALDRVGIATAACGKPIVELCLPNCCVMFGLHLDLREVSSMGVRSTTTFTLLS